MGNINCISTEEDDEGFLMVIGVPKDDLFQFFELEKYFVVACKGSQTSAHKPGIHAREGMKALWPTLRQLKHTMTGSSS